MTTVEWGTIREATTGVLSRCLKQLKCDTLQLPEKSLQDKCPTPGLKDTDAHQCKENCRVDTPPPERGVVSQALGLCPSGMRYSLAQLTSFSVTQLPF